MIQDSIMTNTILTMKGAVMPWHVFRYGHTEWWWTNADSAVSRNSYPTEEEARAAMERYQGAREIETPQS